MSIHNIAFLLDLMREMRAAIVEGRFQAFAERWLARYEAGCAARDAGAPAR